jgi:hypothetical protein
MVVVTHSGHTSSSMDTGEYILFTVGGLVFLIGGFYAVRTANKKK